MRTVLCVVAALALAGCSKDEKAPKAAASASAQAATAAPSASAAASASAAPSSSAAASASAEAEPPHECPAGSTGPGSFGKPCEAKGKARMMEVAWTKTDDKGPSFKVQSKSKLAILYGKVAVYFYDKAGKQIDAKEAVEGSDKTHSFHTCSGGNIFAGAMAAGEKATLTFSCMKKKDIPDGTSTIEAEVQVVGFADSTGKKIDFYWRNTDLTPEERPKGGIK